MRSLCDDDCKIYLMVDCHGVISCTSLIYTDGQRLLSNIGQGREYLFGSLSDRQNDVDRLTTAPLEEGVSAQGAADCMENALTGFALLVSGSFPVTPTTERRVSKVDITRIPLFVRKFLGPTCFSRLLKLVACG